MVVWEMGRLHPARVSSLYNMSVPYSNAPAPPIQIFEALFPDTFFYMLYFQPVGPAEAEFDADPRRFLRTMLYSAGAQGMAHAGPLISDAPREGTRFQDILTPAPDVLPPWITEADVDVYAAAFEKGGFFGPCSYYRNMDANWERSHDIPASVYTMPTGFLTGALDPVALMMPNAAEEMAAALPDYRGTTVVADAAHWVQQEKPAETNAALLSFLSSLMSDLVPLPAQPAGVAWPTDDWPTGEVPPGVELVPCSTRSSTTRGPWPRPSPSWSSTAAAWSHERYAGALEHFDRPPTPVAADTPLLSWSMAKSVLHAVIGLLVGDGKLDLDAPAAVPEWADPGDPRHAITLRQLLAMRDGLDFAEDYVDGEVSDTIQMLFGDGQADMAHFAADRPLAAPPGTRFNYSSGTSNIISGIVARTVGPGESYARFLHSRLFGPLGMTSADPEFDEAGTWVASSYLVRHGPRLRPLRAALPARRRVGRLPPAARGMGRLRPHLGLGGPRGRQPLRRPLVGRGRRHARHLPRLGLRGPVHHALPRAST